MVIGAFGWTQRTLPPMMDGMAVYAAGILPWYQEDGQLFVFLVHHGGPYWRGKDEGAWSLAKGIYDHTVETSEQAARREFTEEVGVPVPEGDLVDLGEVRLSSGKRVRGYAVEASPQLAFVGSNTFLVEWPPRSGQINEYPEIDQGDWFTLEEARTKMIRGQAPLLERLVERLP